MATTWSIRNAKRAALVHRGLSACRVLTPPRQASERVSERLVGRACPGNQLGCPGMGSDGPLPSDHCYTGILRTGPVSGCVSEQWSEAPLDGPSAQKTQLAAGHTPYATGALGHPLRGLPWRVRLDMQTKLRCTSAARLGCVWTRLSAANWRTRSGHGRTCFFLADRLPLLTQASDRFPVVCRSIT